MAESDNFENEPDSVNCPHQKKGCGFKGTIAQLEEHINSCENTPYVCAQGCGQLISPKNLGKHQKEECDYRIEFCNILNCCETFPHKDLEEHNEKCEFFLVDCSYNCGQIVPRHQMKGHLQKCENRIINCSFCTIGCTHQATRKRIKKHESESIGHHLKVLTKLVTDQDTIINKLYAAINQNKEYITSLDSKINELGLKVSTECENLEQEISIRKQLQFNVTEISEQLTAVDSALQSAKAECTQQILATSHELTNVASEQNVVKEKIIGFEQQNKELMQLKSNIDILRETCQAHSNDLEQQKSEIEQCREDNFNSIQDNITSCYYIWKLEEFKNFQQLTAGSRNYLLSDPFYSSQGGYKFCLCLCPNGNNSGKGTHLSSYLVVTEGSMDQILNWPIQCKVIFTLFDQLDGKFDWVKEFTVSLINENDSHNLACRSGSNKVFPRPKRTLNFGRGIAKFIRREKLKPLYIMNDTLFLKAVVLIF